MALFGRKKSTASVASNEDGMKQFLDIKNKLHDTIDSVDNAYDEAVSLQASNKTLAEEWKTRVLEVDEIPTDDVKAKRALGILRREAEARFNHHTNAATKYGETANALSVQLKDLRLTMMNMDDYQREFELTKRLKNMSAMSLTPTVPNAAGLDLKEISRLVHTANALVEIKEGK